MGNDRDIPNFRKIQKFNTNPLLGRKRTRSRRVGIYEYV
jgi:hypothetical protein